MPCKNNEQKKRGTGQCCTSRRALGTLTINDLAQARNEWFPCSHLPSPSGSGRGVSDQDDQNTTTYRTSYCQRPENSGSRPPCPRQKYGPQCQRQREMYVPQRPGQNEFLVPRSPQRREAYVPQNQWQRETYVPQSQTLRQINVPYSPRQRGVTVPQNQRQRQIGGPQIQPQGNICLPQCQASMFEEIQQCRKKIGALANEALNIASEATEILQKLRDTSAQTNQYRVCVGANTSNQNITKTPSKIGITRSNVRVLPRGVDGCTSGQPVKSYGQDKIEKKTSGKISSVGYADCACDKETIKQKKSACKHCCRKTKDQSTSCSPPIVADKCGCAEELKKRKKKKQMNDKKTSCPSLIIVDKCECAKYMKKQVKANKGKYKGRQSDTNDELTSLRESCDMPSCPASNTCKCKCCYQ